MAQAEISDPEELPYEPNRTALYTPDELSEIGLDGISLDQRIFDHFETHGGRQAPEAAEALAQRLHDHGVDEALAGLIGRSGEERLGKRIVGIMGGHVATRGGDVYEQAARLAHLLANHDPAYLVATGGGPGVMEAGNLGAMLAARPPEAVHEACAMLADAPDASDADGSYSDAARSVVERFGPPSPSLAVPTWFYGNEPTNLFATSIAKYFSNGLREEGLLAICLSGVVYCPGASGTLQEAFMDNAQNAAFSYGYSSPMIFLGEKRFRDVYELLRAEASSPEELAMLAIADTPEDVVAILEANPPVAQQAAPVGIRINRSA